MNAPSSQTALTETMVCAANPISLGFAALSRPDFAPSSSHWLEHIPFAYWLVEQSRPSSIVELGVHTGGSYCNFCQAVRDLRLECRCYGIDNFEGDAHYGSYGSDVLANLKSYHDPRYRDFSSLIKNNFEDALSHFEDGTIDILHIDGTHFYEDVRRDYELWKPKLSNRAVVLFHDTNVHERNFGVHRLWKELLQVHRGFEFLHCNGLGVMIPGESPCAALDTLVSADEEATIHIRRLFSTLGERITCFSHLSDAAQRIEKLEADETILRGWLADKEEFARNEVLAHEQLDQIVASLHRKNETLQQQIRQGEQSLEESESRIPALNAEMDELHELNREADASIASLRQEITKIRNLLEEERITTNRLAVIEKEHKRLKSEIPVLRSERHKGQTARALSPATDFLNPEIISKTFRRANPVSKSGLFDEEFYLSQFPANKGIVNPLRHYQMIGWLLGCRPNRLFDPLWYARTYGLNDGLEPLLDYVTTGHQNGRRPHPLFDLEFYTAAASDLATYPQLPFHHYLHYGRKEGRKPCALFDPLFYATWNPGIAMEDALEHFMREGQSSGSAPHPLFDQEWYADTYGDSLADSCPLVHYLEHGHLPAYSPHPLFDPAMYLARIDWKPEGNLLIDYLTHGEVSSVSTHPLFDAARYIERYPHVREPGVPPLLHYCTLGQNEQYSPHILFDPGFYQSRQAGDSTENPLAHYLKAGGRDCPDPHPLFDTRYYLSRCPNPPGPGEIPLIHFLQTAARDGASPHPLFDTPFYLRLYPDVAATGTNPLVHFLTVGADQGRMPNEFFDTCRYRNAAMGDAPLGTNPLVHFLLAPPDQLVDPSRHFHAGWYLQRYPDVAQHRVNPLVHYISTGIAEGRATCEAGARKARLESKYPGITHPAGIDNRTRLRHSQRTPRTRVIEARNTRVNMLFPDLDAEIVFGGYISAFEFLSSLADKHEIRLVCTAQAIEDAGIDELKKKFNNNPRVSKMLQSASLADISNPDTVLDIHPQDVFCAYSAWDALICNKLAQALGQTESFYFCQEDEAIFHSNDSLHALIREAQNLPQFYIFNTTILRDYFLENRLGPFAGSQQAGLDNSMTFQHALVDAKPPTEEEMAARPRTRVLVYARPEGHAKRNLFEITLLGIERFLEDDPALAENLEFTGVGSMLFEGDVPLTGSHSIHIQPKISYSDYAASLSQYDIGISLMYAPHPSILPFEMASAGQVVVTNRFGSRDDSVLTSISGNLIAVDPTPADIANGFRMALEKVSGFKARVTNASFNWSRSWETTFGPEFQTQLAARVARTLGKPKSGPLSDPHASAS